MILLASAQFFGYGPTANLFTILRTLQQKCKNTICINLLKNETTAIFYELNKDININLVDDISLENIDVILSSFDPFLIIHGWLNDIPTIYSCNLFWYWNFSGKISEIKNYKKQLSELKEANHKKEALQLFNEIFIKDPHIGITLGYLLASHCFIRSFPKISDRINELDPSISFTENNIILPKLTISHKKIKNLIFVQLAGSCNPIMSKNDNLIYVNTIIKIIEQLAVLFIDMEFLICINPTLLDDTISSHTINIKIIPSLSQQENFEYLKKAGAIFTSPGLETIFEANYFKTPIFLLPEQNAGQFGNFKILHESGFNVARYLIDEQFPDREKLIGEEDAYLILDKVNTLNTNNNEKLLFINRAKLFLTMLNSSPASATYLDNQNAAIVRHIGEPAYSHGDNICDFILEKVTAIENNIYELTI